MHVRIAAAAATVAVGCLGLASPVQAQAGPAVSIAGTVASPCDSTYQYCFRPATITVAAGDTVTWTSSSSAPHTVTADNGSFDSGDVVAGGTYKHTFTTPGVTVAYHCSIHPYMTGSVTVTGSAQSSSSSVSYASSTARSATTHTTSATPPPTTTAAPPPPATTAAPPAAAAVAPPPSASSTSSSTSSDPAAAGAAAATTSEPSTGGGSTAAILAALAGLGLIVGAGVWWQRRRAGAGRLTP